jgi:hypothetical protein
VSWSRTINAGESYKSYCQRDEEEEEEEITSFQPHEADLIDLFDEEMTYFNPEAACTHTQQT